MKRKRVCIDSDDEPPATSEEDAAEVEHRRYPRRAKLYMEDKDMAFARALHHGYSLRHSHSQSSRQAERMMSPKRIKSEKGHIVFLKSKNTLGTTSGIRNRTRQAHKVMGEELKNTKPMEMDDRTIDKKKYNGRTNCKGNKLVTTFEGDTEERNVRERESSGEESDEEDEGQEEEPTPDGEEEDNREEETDGAYNGSRYQFRKNRPQSFTDGTRRQTRDPIRRGRRRHRFTLRSKSGTSLQRLPHNPVLDVRNKGFHDHSLYQRRRKLGHCYRSSSGSSTSTTNNDERHPGTSMKKDLREEAKFERRKFKSMLKARKELMPINMSEKDTGNGILSIVRERLCHHKNTSSSCADIDPMAVDGTIGFPQIGGLSRHIQSLKEMILFPILYPHLFEHFSVQSPKGVLFYGPPGTGKTLLARALANECGKVAGGQRVAFFMRKGADCLSKWVGESERQLRLLFDQAYKMRPSIIFFDEIDGLAPVRSTRQDQIHSSIVSTLLALMDGIDSRGEVVVIGATNRLDSIDPALRRPGRFDRELRFDLPDCTARRAILQIHTGKWGGLNAPAPELLDWLAQQTSGYCGADLKSLCTEAVLVAIREHYPHIYLSEEKLLLKADNIRVTRQHFMDALRRIVPAAKREGLLLSGQSSKACLDCLIYPFINSESFERRVPIGYRQNTTNLDTMWTNELEKVLMALKTPPTVSAARLLFCGPRRMGQGTHFLPALLSSLDHVPMFCISCEKVFANSNPEENISQTIRNCLRATAQGSAVILALPNLDILENALPVQTWKMLVHSFDAFTGPTSALIIGAIQQPYEQCSEDIKQLFHPNCTIKIRQPKRKSIQAYFDTILLSTKQHPLLFKPEDYPEPSKVSTEISANNTLRKVSKAELIELDKIYQQMLRQFRIFLRDLLRQLVREARFKCFNLPVDKEDAEDYYEIVKKPMCLSQMMHKIDTGEYRSKEEFLRDIYLIRDNALEYNPDKDMDGKQIRHAGNALVDMAEALFQLEMDDDFSERLTEAQRLVEEGKSSQNSQQNDQDGCMPVAVPMAVESSSSLLLPSSNGVTEGKRQGRRTSYAVNSAAAANKEIPSQLMDYADITKELREGNWPPPLFLLDEKGVDRVIEQATKKCRTLNLGVLDIECLGAELAQIADRYRNQWDRSALVDELLNSVEQFTMLID